MWKMLKVHDIEVALCSSKLLDPFTSIMGQHLKLAHKPSCYVNRDSPIMLLIFNYYAMLQCS